MSNFNFYIKNKLKKSIIFDTRVIPEYKSLLTDCNRAHSYGRKYLIDKGLNPNLYDVIVVEPSVKVEEEDTLQFDNLITQIEDDYNYIEVKRNNKLNIWERIYKLETLIHAKPEELFRLKHLFPFYEFKHNHNNFYTVDFKKKAFWGYQRLPEI